MHPAIIGKLDPETLPPGRGPIWVWIYTQSPQCGCNIKVLYYYLRQIKGDMAIFLQIEYPRSVCEWCVCGGGGGGEGEGR